MMPLTRLSASHDGYTGFMASHDQKSHVALHFDCHDQGNAVVPLTMLLA